MEQKHETRCALDGHSFDNTPVQYVDGIDHVTNAWQKNTRIFCSVACARRYTRKFCMLDPQILIWTETYFRNVLQVRHSLVAPDPVVLACFNDTGKGLSIEDYRNTSVSCTWVEKVDGIEKNVFIQEPQKDRVYQPFEQLALKDMAGSQYSRDTNEPNEDPEDGIVDEVIADDVIADEVDEAMEDMEEND
jgi:hypothetical protein